MEQPADDPAHQQHRNEHGRQRQGHGENREADFACSVERRLHGPLSHLEVADDVLEHHDGVVYHKSHRQRERHQGEVVETVAHQVHDGERADDRKGQGEARNDRGGQILEEQENHEHDEAERDEQRDLHVVDRLVNRDGAVVERVHLDRRRQLAGERRDGCLDRVRDLHGVGAGLALNREHDRALAVIPARIA